MTAMKRHLTILAFSLFTLIAAGIPVFAQEPVTGVSNPEALFTSKDKKLNANKQVVLHIVRDLLEANHWDDAPKYISQRYVQHNPNVPSGLIPVMQYFAGRTSKPIPDKNGWTTKVVSVVAEGDLVTVATVRSLPDPRDPTKMYTTTWFDMWRIKDGQADEHWDYGTIAAPTPARGGAPDGQRGRGQR
jgi:predicted SnoaL-like aldol condensation-catalyzing enzyme